MIVWSENEREQNTADKIGRAGRGDVGGGEEWEVLNF